MFINLNFSLLPFLHVSNLFTLLIANRHRPNRNVGNRLQQSLKQAVKVTVTLLPLVRLPNSFPNAGNLINITWGMMNGPRNDPNVRGIFATTRNLTPNTRNVIKTNSNFTRDNLLPDRSTPHGNRVYVRRLIKNNNNRS